MIKCIVAKLVVYFGALICFSSIYSVADSQAHITKISFGVEGKSEQMIQWAKMYDKMEMKHEVVLFLLSHDTPVDPQSCNDLTIVCIFRPNTTWTSGRNQLVQRISQFEQTHQHHFKYWLFADQDFVRLASPCGEVVKQCQINPQRPVYSIEAAACCFDFTTGVLVAPEVEFAAINFVAFSGGGNRQYPSFLHHDCADGAMNAFHRQAVPVVFPMIDLVDKNTWWESQGMHFHIVKGCFAGHFVISNIFGVNVNNDHGSAYPRGRCPNEAITAMKSIYGKVGLVPDVISLNTSMLDQGNCANVVPHSNGLDEWFEQRMPDFNHRKTNWPSDGWKNSTNYQKCFHALKPRFLKFIDSGDLTKTDGQVYLNNNCTGNEPPLDAVKVEVKRRKKHRK